MRLASRSLWKTSWPLSGHFTQRLSGLSRRNSDRIFGGTTLEIQFMIFLYDVGRALLPVLHARASSSTSPMTARVVLGLATPSINDRRTASTRADPTTTPSAVSAIAAALEASLTPNPTATGNAV